MEPLGLIIGLVAAAWFFGFHRSARNVADMANEKVEEMMVEQTANNIKHRGTIQLTEEDLEKANRVTELVNSFRQ